MRGSAISLENIMAKVNSDMKTEASFKANSETECQLMVSLPTKTRTPTEEL